MYVLMLYTVSSNIIQCHNVKNRLQWKQVQWTNIMYSSMLFTTTFTILYFVYILFSSF